MKILIVSTLYSGDRSGGAERVAALSAHGFRQAGCDVAVLTSRPFGGFGSFAPRVFEDDENVRVYSFFPCNFAHYATVHRWPRLLRYLWTLFDIFNIHTLLVAARVLRRERPDIVITHNLRGLGYLLPRLFARHAQYYVHVVHDVQLIEPSGVLYPHEERPLLKRISRRYYRALTRQLFAPVPHFIFPSRYLQKFHQSYGFIKNSRHDVLRNPTAPSPRAKQEHEDVSVVFIGGLEEQKGIRVLLDAWQRQRPSDARLLVTGEGTLAAEVERRARTSTNVVFLGYLSDAASEAVWAEADVVVLPSLLIENSPTVLAEALARGVAIVASAVGGVHELVELSPAHWLVSPGDVSALAAGMGEAIAEIRKNGHPAPVAVMHPRIYAESLLSLMTA